MANRFDQIDEQLKAWVSEWVDVTTVSLDPPDEESSEHGVSLFLFDLTDSPLPHTGSRTPYQVFLRYLVTTWADTPQEAHRTLGELVFAAMESEAFELELATPPATLWQTLGVVPRPSFFLRVPCRRTPARPDPGMVRQPLVLETAPLRGIAGRVAGPGDIPVSGAAVEFPALNTRTTTDRNGQFKLHGIPQQSNPERLVVRARGMKSETEVDLSVDDDQPLEITLTPEG